MYSVRRTVYGVLCTMYSVRRTVYGVLCTMYSVRRTVYGVHYLECQTKVSDTHVTLPMIIVCIP